MGSASAPAANCHSDVGSNLTEQGAILGTPAYMPPEQYRGEMVDARTDQFAYAVSAWEVLFGRLPFEGRRIHDLVAAAMSGDIVPPPRSEIPAAIPGVLRRALAAHPDDRDAGMQELLTALGQAARTRWRLFSRLRGLLRPRDRN